MCARPQRDGLRRKSSKGARRSGSAPKAPRTGAPTERATNDTVAVVGTETSAGPLDGVQALRAESTASAPPDTAAELGDAEPGETELGEGADAAFAGAARSQEARGYEKILALLSAHAGVDFSRYKSTTILRRIRRRLVLHDLDTFESYAALLRGSSSELGALYTDVLISVTHFFRDPEAFALLQAEVLPLLLQRVEDPLRCWVLGCSTGQEAYSIAMAFIEAAEKAPRQRRMQIFATDLNDTLLDKARSGLYPKSIAEELTPARLERFFEEEEGGYRVCKLLREMVVFARQNLVADPPFSRMSLISCRNVLIYLQPSLQKKAIATFHYALKPGGFLMLGASESIGSFKDLFEPLDKKTKLFSRKPAPSAGFHVPFTPGQSLALGARSAAPMQPLDIPEHLQGERNAQREADRITVNRFGPPAVLVDTDFAVRQFRGSTNAFLKPPVGKATFDVLKMAREGLMLSLRAALNQAKQEDRPVRIEDVRVEHRPDAPIVNLEVVPLKTQWERFFLILFEEVAGAESNAVAKSPVPRTPLAPWSAEDERTRIAELEAEASEARDHYQSLQEEHEAANEELQAASEEVQSTNEELQSLNEELETSKEELQSTNEVLTTLNEQMHYRNTELNRLNNDLENLQTSTKLAIVLLGRDLKLRRFSLQAEKQFDLLSADVGQPISHVRHSLVLELPTETPLDLARISAEVISDVREQEREVHDKKSDRWYLLRVRPYLMTDSRVEGAVLVLVDITERKRAGEAPSRLAAIVSSSDDAIISMDLQGTIQTWNQGAQRLFGYTAEEALGTEITRLLPEHQGDEGAGLLARIGRGESIKHFETRRRRKGGTQVDISLTLSPVLNAAGHVVGAAKIARDISERKRMDRALRRYSTDLADADGRKNEFLAMLGHELRNPLAALTNGLEVLGGVGADRERAETLRTMMVRQTGRMNTLLDQLLDVAGVISGKVELSKKRVDLLDVVRAAVETARSLIERQRHTLTLSLPSEGMSFVVGDAVRLTQVVENLLINAAKYTDPGGQIGVTLETTEETCIVSVRDTGIGITDDFLPHVFEVFAQAPRTLDRAKGGLGLGLPLVYRLTAMHGGKVTASSAGLNRGSEFVVTLPRVMERRSLARLDRDRASEQVPASRAMRILVVDDQVDSADMLAELLTGLGHQTLAVNDGPAALAAIGPFQPAVVLLDLGLPELDGYEVAQRLRAEHTDMQLLLIAVTGYQSDVNRLRQAGFDHHLIKPVSLQKVAAILSALDTGATVLA